MLLTGENNTNCIYSARKETKLYSAPLYIKYTVFLDTISNIASQGLGVKEH